MKKIIVCGAGTMGSGIAQICAGTGYDVWMYDLKEEYAATGKQKIAAGLEKQVLKGKLTEAQKAELLSHLYPVCDIHCAKDADLIIEAVLEDFDVKTTLYKQLEDVCPSNTIIGTNTSYLPITSLASCMKNPERFIGMHFFNPVYAMKLLEVIKGKSTSDAVVEKVCAFAKTVRKEVVIVKKDTPGFIVNRLNKAIQIEALRLLHEEVASIEDIDKAARLGLNYPMGPFELMDGNLELTYHCLNLLSSLTGEDRFRPTPELEAHIQAGEFGRRTGKGWYDYSLKDDRA